MYHRLILLRALALSCLLLAVRHCACQRIKLKTNAKRDPNKLNVHIICHTHDDAGWLKTADQYYYGARQDIQLAGVQFIITSVIQALRDSPDRKFVYGEMAFFTRWWEDQTDHIKDVVKGLVKRGQLDFVNGGYVQHDEAAAHYVAMIDQTTRGHRFLNETFGKSVKVGWQLDPFGHSATQAALMSAAVGFEGLFFGRADYQDVALREKQAAMELIWRPSLSWAPGSADVFLHNHEGYTPVWGFNYEWALSGDPMLVDDPESPDYNIPQRVAWFLAFVKNMARTTRGNDVLVMMGTDFTYASANPWFINIDRLMHFVNEDGEVNMFYSTPAEFIAAKKSYDPAKVQWPLKTDDFFPYADCPHCYWTGYFTSRPTSKRYIRAATSYLQVARQLEVLADMDLGGSDLLEAAVSLTQHHDAITGTEKQHVANDYHRRIHKGWMKAEGVVNCALRKLLTAQTHTDMQQDPQLVHPSTRRLSSILSLPPHVRPSLSSTPPANMELFQCHYINASICSHSVVPTGKGQDLLVVLYNPLGWSRSQYVQLPIGAGPYNWQVQDASGANLTSQLQHVHDSTKFLQQALLISGEQKDLSTFASQHIAWKADLPPLGLKTFYIRSYPSPSLARMPTPITPVPQGSPPVEVSNSKLRLSFNSNTGLLESMAAADGSWSMAAKQELLWYRGSDGREPDREGMGSGAYIFRLPQNGPQDPFPIADGPVMLEVVRGALVQEIHQHFAPWAHLTTRLWEDEGWVEQEWTVGPIPAQDHVAREVITRFTTDLDTKGILFTDSNGREMLKRVRNYRPSWELVVNEPVAGNYYPITSAAAIQDGKLRFTVMTERAQGAASIEDGQIEIMVHRRGVSDDQRGVGENLNETQCYCRDCHCHGLIARGTHILLVEPLATAAATARTLQVQLNDPPVMAFKTLQPPTTSEIRSAITPRFSAMLAPEGLPSNVHLLTLMKLDDSRILIRLAHNLQTGEHGDLAAPVTVDLSQILSTPRISSIQELTLSASQYRSEAPPKPHSWPIEDTERTKKAEADMAGFKQYDITHHEGDKLPVVELFPMEIRAFELTVAAPT